MKPITAKATVELTVEQVNKINELIARDKPQPIVEKVLENFGNKTIYLCPTCGRALGRIDHEDPFCRGCGQHLDTYNIAL